MITKAQTQEPKVTDVVLMDYPERNVIRSYPFVRVMDTKKHLICDMWTMKLVKQQAKYNGWNIVKVVKVPPTDRVKEEPKDDEEE